MKSGNDIADTRTVRESEREITAQMYDITGTRRVWVAFGDIIGKTPQAITYIFRHATLLHPVLHAPFALSQIVVISHRAGKRHRAPFLPVAGK
ncbi:isochorismate synthase [Prevotella sp. MGM1]|nr:isochorismate synthase [Prevotella sp. MGM1]